jgi:hypothetical protein
MSLVKFELWAWSDAELKLESSKALLGAMEENLCRDGNKADSEALMGIRILLEGAITDMKSGRVYGKEKKKDGN